MEFTGKEFKYDLKEFLALKMLDSFEQRYNRLLDTIADYLAYSSMFEKAYKTLQERQAFDALTRRIRADLAPVVYMLETLAKDVKDDEIQSTINELKEYTRQISKAPEIKVEWLEKVQWGLAFVVAKLFLAGILVSPVHGKRRKIIGTYERYPEEE